MIIHVLRGADENVVDPRLHRGSCASFSLALQPGSRALPRFSKTCLPRRSSTPVRILVHIRPRQFRTMYEAELFGSQDSASIPKTVSNDTPETPQAKFNHAALDYAPDSIRLIQVIPELSPEGYVQCRIRRATISTATTYTCISYVWGSADRGDWITLDGRRFWARKNLSRFLEYARRTRLSHWLWIDALCIDQANTRERNHQVKQMGRIFSKAVEVISWLGDVKEIAWFLREVRDNDPRFNERAAFTKPFPDVWFGPYIEQTNDILDTKAWQDGLHAMLRSDYWDRAWILQEVRLARKVTLMSRSEYLPMQLLPWDALTTRYMFSRETEGYLWRLLRLKPAENNHDRQECLVMLLWTYRGTACAFPRDRLYSLLSLCGAGCDLVVDYASANETVAVEALRTCRDWFCFCSTQILGDALSIGYGYSASRPEATTPFAKAILPVGDERTRDVFRFATDAEVYISEGPRPGTCAVLTC